MSISTLITDGFGSFGDVAHIVTLGLDIGEDVSPPSDLGGAEKSNYHGLAQDYLSRFRKKQKEDAAREALEREKEVERESVTLKESEPPKEVKRKKVYAALEPVEITAIAQAFREAKEKTDARQKIKKDALLVDQALLIAQQIEFERLELLRQYEEDAIIFLLLT